MAHYTITVILLFCFASTSFFTNSTETKSRIVKIRPNRQGKYKGKCVDVTRDKTDIVMECGPKEVIYSIDATSYNSTRCNDDITKVCSGLQPYIITDINFCHFDSVCTLAFNDSTPIMVTSEYRCIGSKPSKLRLSYNCAHKAAIHYFINMFHRKRNKTSERTKDMGMLVSHRRYPWNYPQGITYEVVLKPKTPTKTKLFISVPVVELSNIGDVVLVTNYSNDNDGEDIAVKKTAVGESVFIRPSTEPQTSVKFYTDMSPHSAKGFIICYCWVDEVTDLSHFDICSRLGRPRRRKGVLRDINLRESRQRKRKRRKKKRRRMKKQRKT